MIYFKKMENLKKNSTTLDQLLINNSKEKNILIETLYLTKKILSVENTILIYEINDILDLKDKYKQKYKINSHYLQFNIGICALYLDYE